MRFMTQSTRNNNKQSLRYDQPKPTPNNKITPTNVFLSTVFQILLPSRPLPRPRYHASDVILPNDPFLTRRTASLEIPFICLFLCLYYILLLPDLAVSMMWEGQPYLWRGSASDWRERGRVWVRIFPPLFFFIPVSPFLNAALPPTPAPFSSRLPACFVAFVFFGCL